MHTKIIKLILPLLLIFFTLPVFAEVIVLKSGEKITASIIDKNDNYIKIDFKGSIITYHAFEIESIDGNPVNLPKKESSTGEKPQSLSETLTPPPKSIETNIVTAEEYLKRGIVYYNKDELGQAILNFDNVIKINPLEAQAYLYRGLAYANKNNLTQSISDYNKAIEINPKNEEAYFVRGRAYAADQKPDQAIADYSKAIELNPKYVQAYINRAFLNIVKGDKDAAVVDVNKVIEINPNLAGAYYIRGLAYANKGNLEQAITDYTKAIEINPQYAEAYANRGLAYAFSIVDLAKSNPNSPMAYVNTGLDNLDKTKFNQAISDYTKAIEINPRYLDAYILRSRMYIMAKDFDKAWADVHKVEEVGGVVKPEFLEELKKASGRDK